MSEINLPEGWAHSTIADFALNVNGLRKPVSLSERASIKGEYPYYGATGQIDALNNYTHEGEHVLIGEDGANLLSKSKDLAFIVKGKFWVNNHAHALKCVAGVPSKYLASFINSIDLTPYVTGSAQPKLTKGNLDSIDIPVAPLAEQQQIAQKLDELLAQVDTLKTRLDAIPNILKRFRQSVLAAAVSGRLTEGAVNLRFVSDVCEKAFDGPFGSKLKTSDYTDSGVRVARLENIGHLYFDNDKQTFISIEKAEELESNRLKQGDVLFSSFVDEGVRVCVFKQKEAFINKADCFCLRPDVKKVSSEFLAYTLSSVTSYFQIKEQVQGVTRPRINLKILKSLSFNFPAVEEQTEIVRRVEQLFAYADQIEQRVKDAQARVNHLTQSILAKAFRGELTADWRAQNPELISGENSAAKLLERIKVEREKVGKVKRKVKACPPPGLPLKKGEEQDQGQPPPSLPLEKRGGADSQCDKLCAKLKSPPLIRGG